MCYVSTFLYNYARLLIAETNKIQKQKKVFVVPDEVIYFIFMDFIYLFFMEGQDRVVRTDRS